MYEIKQLTINNIENMDPKNKEKAEKIFSKIDTLNYYKQSWENATNVRVPMIELNSPNPNKYPNVPIDLTSFKILKENCLKEINTKLEELNKQLKDL
jgi:hypothetical protein